MDFFRKLFKADFMPHGHCYFWQPDVLWANVIGDGITALAYFLIPIGLYYFIRRRRNAKYPYLFVLFALFILLCGTTHVLEIVSVWDPIYRFEGLLKLITGMVSIITAGALIYVIPMALKIPSPSELAAANKKLEERTNELKSQNEFLRNLAYATFHDLREPARGMAINSQVLMLRHRDELNDDVREIVDHIGVESKRMYGSVESIIKLSFLESEQYEFSGVDLNETLKEVVEHLGLMIKNHRVEINS
ncbi:MAG TPA: hypothetical protein VG603_14505, partial [Chitinophagales bacterium]|nr:hypothetical protein [Chitinophagales bacterium]